MAPQKTSLFNADAHEVALAAREEATSALINADAHGWSYSAWQPVRRLRCSTRMPMKRQWQPVKIEACEYAV